MLSGLQFVTEIATSCIVKHKLLETFYTDLLFAVFVLHKWQELCKEDLMYIEQDIVMVIKYLMHEANLVQSEVLLW